MNRLMRIINSPEEQSEVDPLLVWSALALLLIGLIMVYSASIALPDSPKFAKYTQTHFFSRHLMSLSLAISAAAIVTQIPLSTWERVAPWLFVLALILLVNWVAG